MSMLALLAVASAAPASTSVGKNCDPSLDAAGNWKQCLSGSRPNEIQCCSDGFTCYKKKAGYGQCRKTGDTTFSDGTEAIESYPRPVLVGKNCDPSLDAAGNWKQCLSGSRPNEIQCCSDGFTCYKKKAGYGQCRKTGDTTFSDGTEAIESYPKKANDGGKCVLRSKNGCEPINPAWHSWEHKTLHKDTESDCRNALKFWTGQCNHHIAATYGHKILFVQQTHRYTSTCSHVHCISDDKSGITVVKHHHLEHFGHKHICKDELHSAKKVSLITYP